MNTMIASVFPGCGKTYLSQLQNELKFKYLGFEYMFSIYDLDSSLYEKKDGWEKEFVDDILSRVGTVDFIFIPTINEIQIELNKRAVPYVVVGPDNAEWSSERDKRLCKQQWFGRFILRDNSSKKDFVEWMKSMMDNYDNMTTIEALTKNNPATFFLLKETQYLSDIIVDLYDKKERNSDLYCYGYGKTVISPLMSAARAVTV